MEKKHLYIFLSGIITLILCSCGVPEGHVRLSGKISQVKEADCFIYSTDESFTRVDTIHISGGKFETDIPLKKPIVMTLLLPSFSQVSFIAEPDKEITFKASAEKLAEIEIHGSEMNDQLTEFRLKNLQKSDREKRLAAVQFINDNIKSLTAIAVFREYFLENKDVNPIQAQELIEKLQNAQGKNHAVKTMVPLAEARIAGSEGMTIPEFAGETLDGNIVSKDNFAGKPALFYFTASWSNHFVSTLKTIRNLERMPDRNFNILVIALDYDTRTLQQHVERDSIVSPVLCDQMAFDSPNVRNFGITYVPGNILIGSNGRIVERDVDDAKLPDRLKQLK